MNDWRRYRPAIWLAMLGIALALLISPAIFGFVVLGMGAGLAFRLRFPNPRRGGRPSLCGRPATPRLNAARRSSASSRCAGALAWCSA